MSLKKSLLIAGLTSGLALAAPAAALADASPSTTTALVQSSEQAPAPAPVPASNDDSHYAQRENQDKAVQSYRGGDTIVIGVSAGAVLVALLIVLLLV
jgi:hypothetical protein